MGASSASKLHSFERIAMSVIVEVHQAEIHNVHSIKAGYAVMIAYPNKLEQRKVQALIFKDTFVTRRPVCANTPHV
jgi:hypothetical protein